MILVKPYRVLIETNDFGQDKKALVFTTSEPYKEFLLEQIKKTNHPHPMETLSVDLLEDTFLYLLGERHINNFIIAEEVEVK